MAAPDLLPSDNKPIESLRLDGAEGLWLYPRLISTLVIGMLLYIPLVFLANGPMTQQVAPVMILIGAAVSWFIYRRGSVRRAILVIVWVLMGSMLLQGVVRGGLVNPSLQGLVVLMLIGGWLLGPLHGLILGAASILGTLLMLLAIRHGYIHPESIDDGVSYWLAQATISALGAILMWSVIKAHWRYLRQVKSLNAKLTESIVTLSSRERALAASENRFMRMHESSPVPITLSRIDNGTYIDVNPAWVSMFGWSREEVRGKTSLEIGFFANPEMRKRGLELFKRDGRAQVEVTANNAQGGQRELVCSVELIDYEGSPAALTIMFDLTDRKRIENELRQMNDVLEQRVAERTAELESVVRDLNQTLTDLHHTQDELVQSEKHASLGRLVAGVAHELNTPIGNALTASSTLSGELHAFERSVKAGELKRSEVNRLIEYGQVGADLIERSLRRAATLVQSFKQVAVDQASEQRRGFDLSAVVNEVIDTLRPSLNQSVWQIENHVPEGIMLDSYPGPLGQILTNLVMNASVHAFEGRPSGQLIIEGTLTDELVQLSCRDNGVGIAPEIIGRIFDPFFTTKLGQGGSGLGLAIVQQLATHLLGGQIGVESQPGEGSNFVLKIPRVAPIKKAANG